VDDVLGDGIHDQDLLDNDCYKEIQSHMDLKSVSRNDYERVTAEEAIKALIRDSVSLPNPIKKRLQNYQVYFINKKFRHFTIFSVYINYYIYTNHSFSYFKRIQLLECQCLQLAVES